jgi:MATE family multidrug resistance protein
MTLRTHFGETFKLALPVVIGQVGSLLMSTTDNLMVGRLGEQTLSAASLGVAVYIMIAILGIGATNAIPALVAEARGANRTDDLQQLLSGSFWFGIINGLVICLLVISAAVMLPHMKQPAADVALAQPYLWLLAFSVLPNHLFLALKGYFDGLGKTQVGMTLSWLGVLVNIGLNWLLIFGMWGFPAWGLFGSGVATLITRVLQLIVLVLVMRNHSATRVYWTALWVTNRSRIWQITRLGFPMGLQIFFELAAFSGATIMLGWLPDASVSRSAHQITLNLAAMTFMVSLGLSVAGSVRVGVAYGRRNLKEMRDAGAVALTLGIMVMAGFGVLLYIFRFQLAPLYGFAEGDAVWHTTARLMVIAAVFQIFDGAQCIGAGILRGCQDVRIPTWITFFAYWVVWIPLANYFCFVLGWGVLGVWWGDVLALALAAVLLNWRFFSLVSHKRLGKEWATE